MNDMEKRKLWLRYSLAHDKMVDNKKPCIESFPKSNGTIRWNQTRYGVFADDLIKSGVIIEEVPALVLHTTVEDINTKETFDQILASVCIKYPDVHEIFNELGHPIIVPMGNFFAYKQGTKAEYIFDRTFNIVTIRSTRPIEKNEEIVLRDIDGEYGYSEIPIDSYEIPESSSRANEDKPKKCKGCDCDKKNKEKPIVNQELVANKKEKSKFKSMVTGDTLQTIKMNENS